MNQIFKKLVIYYIYIISISFYPWPTFVNSTASNFHWYQFQGKHFILTRNDPI